MKRQKYGLVAASAIAVLLVSACSSHQVATATPTTTPLSELKLIIPTSQPPTLPDDAALPAPVTSAPESLASTSEPTTTEASIGLPTHSYIAVCSSYGSPGQDDALNEIQYFDVATGSLVHFMPAVKTFYNAAGLAVHRSDGTTSTFSATGSVPLSQAGFVSYGCAGYSFDESLSIIAGIDLVGTDGKDAVPAFYNIQTGSVTDVVQAAPPSGFDSSAGTVYVAAAFDPKSSNMWTAKVEDNNDLTIQELTVGGMVQFAKTVPYANAGTSFSPVDPNSDRVFFDFSTDKVQPVLQSNRIGLVWGVPGSPGILPASLLPQTDLIVGPIKAADDGSGGAFIATSNTDHSKTLYTVPKAGGEPTKVGPLPPLSAAPVTMDEIIRYVP